MQAVLDYVATSFLLAFFSPYFQYYRQNNCRGRSHTAFSASAGYFSDKLQEKHLVINILVISHFSNLLKKKKKHIRKYFSNAAITFSPFTESSHDHT